MAASMDAATFHAEALIAYIVDVAAYTSPEISHMKSIIKPPFESTTIAHEKKSKLFLNPFHLYQHCKECECLCLQSLAYFTFKSFLLLVKSIFEGKEFSL